MFKAYLRVSTDAIGLGEIQDILGLEPTRSRLRGSKQHALSPESLENIWYLDFEGSSNGRSRADDFSREIEALSRQVVEGVGDLVRDHSASAQVVFVREVHDFTDALEKGISFSMETVRVLAAMGASIVIDEYFYLDE